MSASPATLSIIGNGTNFVTAVSRRARFSADLQSGQSLERGGAGRRQIAHFGNASRFLPMAPRFRRRLARARTGTMTLA
jgi:hypothetical protein